MNTQSLTDYATEARITRLDSNARQYLSMMRERALTAQLDRNGSVDRSMFDALVLSGVFAVLAIVAAVVLS